MGIADWEGMNLYVTTWDMNGEGEYVPIQPNPSDWFFGGASENSHGFGRCNDCHHAIVVHI